MLWAPRKLPAEPSIPRNTFLNHWASLACVTFYRFSDKVAK